MSMRPGTAKTVEAIIDAALRGELDETGAQQLHALGPEAVALAKLAGEEHSDGNARRLTHRLRKYGEFLFTFLDYADVPFENNFAERQIRPAVILRKNSQSNRSDRGAATQAILMSVCRTLRLRGLNPTKTIADALKTYLTTGHLPPLPDADIADG